MSFVVNRKPTHSSPIQLQESRLHESGYHGVNTTTTNHTGASWLKAVESTLSLEFSSRNDQLYGLCIKLKQEASCDTGKENRARLSSSRSKRDFPVPEIFTKKISTGGAMHHHSNWRKNHLATSKRETGQRSVHQGLRKVYIVTEIFSRKR